MRVANKEDRGDREEYTMGMVRFLLINFKLAYPAATSYTSSKTFQRAKTLLQLNGPSTLIAAALAAGCMEALQGIFKASGGELDEEVLMRNVEPFGIPLVIAASTGPSQNVRAIIKYWVDHIHAGLDNYAGIRAHQAFLAAIPASMEEEQRNTAIFLLKIYIKYFSPTAWAFQFRKWLFLAIDSGDTRVVEAVLGLKPQNQATKCYVDGFKMACQKGHEDIARLFIERNLLHVNQEFYREFFLRTPTPPCHGRYWDSPLSLAARHNFIRLVRYLLDERGVSPNGTRSQPQMPLYEALIRQKYAMALILRAHGATEIDIGSNPENNWVKHNSRRTINQSKSKEPRPEPDYGSVATYNQLFRNTPKLMT
jgi:hypothetical protein